MIDIAVGYFATLWEGCTTFEALSQHNDTCEWNISPQGLERVTFESLLHVSELILFILLVFNSMIVS